MKIAEHKCIFLTHTNYNTVRAIRSAAAMGGDLK